MATIYEVSELAGVSLATVSRVMNDNGRVSEKTRRKVLAAMEELDYRPNSIAQSLASHRSNCVGVVVSELHGPVFGAMLSGIESELRAAGKFTIFATGHNQESKEREAIRFLTGRNCDALILHVEALPDEYLQDNKESTTPFVILNRSVPGLEDQCLTLDNELGGYIAAEMVLDMGHREIAYISGPLSWHDASDRLEGHQRALATYGVEYNDKLMVEGNYHEAGGGAALSSLLEQAPSFTAVVCANDETAAGAMDAARARGLSLPEDLSIVGFDNAPLSRYLYPKLTTVNYPVADMGCMAARWVLKHAYLEDSLEIQNVFEPGPVRRGSAVRAAD